MDLHLTDKIAFVAASSSGLGKSVAIELAKEGVQVIICGRNPDTLNKAKAEIEKFGNVFAIAGDLTNSNDRDKIINAALEKYNHIDVLITNTGGPPTGKFEELTPEDWDTAYQQLLVSATGLIRGFLPEMKTNQWGRIITITSQAVKQPVDNLILSNSIRASIVGLVKSLSNELGAFNITVNNVMPGYTQTARLDRLIQNNPTVASVTKEIPLGRFGQPREFAAAVTFLASERASYITGVSLAVDGGWIRSIM
jgi:3-oxoacyl-[acyl-carrier protein] reductase